MEHSAGKDEKEGDDKCQSMLGPMSGRTGVLLFLSIVSIFKLDLRFTWGFCAMAQRRKTISEEFPAGHQCCHHWVIETGIGPASMGVCRLCGEHKEFNNNLRTCLAKSTRGGRAGPVKQRIPEPSVKRRNREELRQAIAAVTQGEMLDQWLHAASRLEDNEKHNSPCLAQLRPFGKRRA